MKSISLYPALLCGIGSAILFSTAFGHGGTYHGPGDTVPGGGSGGGQGGPTTPTPTPGNPSGPTGGTPTGGSPPGVGGATGGPAPRGTGGVSGPNTGTDLTNWEFWWNFNKDRFLGLRSALYTSLATGSFLEEGARNTLVPSAADIRQKVVPALEQALDTERQNDIVTGALVALAKIGDVRGEDGRSPFEERFKKWLSDPTQEIAETSAVALGILAGDGSVRTLAELATDSAAGRKLVGRGEVPVRTRAFAAYGLGLVGARTATNGVRAQIVDELVLLTQQPEGATRDLKVAAIIALGLTPLDWSAESAFDGKAGASSSRSAQIRFLQAYLGNTSHEKLVRAHVPGALAHLLAKDKQPAAEGLALCESVVRDLAARIGEHSSEREELRQSCILALGQLADLDDDAADEIARAELRRNADHGQPQERAFALIALGQIAGRPGSGQGALRTLNGLRGELVAKLGGGSTGVRPWAALGLGISERSLEDLGSSAFAPSAFVKQELRTALQRGQQDLAGAFAIALGIARDSEAAPILGERLLAASDPNQQGYLALALGMIDARDSKADIQRLVRESKYKPELLRQAAIALGLLGDKTLVPELVRMLAESKSLASQAAVASALGFIGDARSIDPLVAMLHDKLLSEPARGFAAVALGIVADKESLPWNAKVSIDINYRANTSTLTTPEGTGLLDIL
jgi:HEAT repeat protein